MTLDDKYPNTFRIGSKEFNNYSPEVHTHLEQDPDNIVFITHYNKPRYVLMNAEKYRELIRHAKR